MSGTNVPLVVTVYMDQRDITPWCRSVMWSQPDRFLERRWTVTTHAWHLFDAAARYDIYASYDPANPRDTCVIRQGYILSDQRMRVVVDRTDQPLITINGGSWSSSSFRRSANETLVLLPCAAGAGKWDLARRVLLNYDGPVGGHIRPVDNMWDLRRMVIYLGHRAQFSVDYHGPNIPMQPVVVPPQLSYWEAILQLIEPYALEVYYEDFGNMLFFIDPLSRPYGRPAMNIPGSLIQSVDAAPVHRNRPRRVIVKVRRWV